MRPSRRPAPVPLRLAVLLALSLVCCPLAGASEQLDYGWKLKGFGGAILGLFFPDSGAAVLRTETGEGDLSTILLELTSPKREGEFYRYGTEIGAQGAPVRVWSAYRFRGKAKERERDIAADEQVLDFSSAIQMLRRERPGKARGLRLWSDGKEYPLTVSPEGDEEIECGGRNWRARHYVIQGRRVEGERYWKGRFQLWLADDEASTPVRIVGERGLLTVRLDLADVTREGNVLAPASDRESGSHSH